ncbi:PAS domain S-box protein [Paucidesulfovibrio longus]|uniref:PAS domain S-box protein n=1 Tax=Paucidesulfovibrio longus TaxID=889 RepID=UPI0003B43022|nr:PAS domain S-box protein [Paucidesulfovibrio longus]
MFKPLLSRLGTRFSLVLLGSILATAALVAFVSLDQINDLGQFSAEQNERNIRALARDGLTTLIAERARHYQSVFKQAESEARLIASGVGRVLDDREFYGAKNFNEKETIERHPVNGVFTNDYSSLASGTYWDSDAVTPKVIKEFNALSHVDPLLRHAKDSTAGSVAAWAITADGYSRYFPNVHHADFMPRPETYDFRDDICFTSAAPEHNPSKSLVWNEIYQDSMGQGLVVTVSMPAYGKDGRFLASTGIDISVQRLVRKVLAGLGDTGFSFLITGEGKLIAFPAGRLALFGLGRDTQLMPGELLRHKLNDSSSIQVRQVAKRMLSEDEGIAPLVLDGEPYLLAFQRLPATNWRLGYVAAEDELLSSVHRTRQALDQARVDTTRSILMVTLLLLPVCFATTLFFFMRNLFSPVRRILDVIRRVARGDMDARVHLSQNDELSELAEAVNDMTDRLTEKQTFLARAESKYRTLFENATVGLYRSTPSGQLLSANKTMANMFGFTSPAQCVSEMVDLASQAYVNPLDRELFRRNVEQTDKPEPFEFQMRRVDGTIIWVESTAKTVRGTGGDVLFYEGSMIDITDRKRAEEYRKILSRELIRIQEFERRRVALDLHDNVAQDLSALKIAFETLFDDEGSLAPRTQERATRCADILGKSIASVRNMAHDLRPSGLDQIGLVQTLADYCRSYGATTGLRVDFSSAGMDNVRLEGDAGIHVFRILQEALNNVRKHSRADEVKVRLVASHPNVILRVEDNGEGFDPALRTTEALSEKRMGLLGMRERADMLGGRFDLQSLPGKGTRLLVEFPLPGQPPANGGRNANGQQPAQGEESPPLSQKEWPPDPAD